MEKLPPKQRKIKGATREELLQLDKNELVQQIIQLEAHNTQLKNIISKNISSESNTEKSFRNKPYDFTKCNFRRVLLKILYFGWDYHGLAVQEDSNLTIEHHLFYALIKTCLIESRETSQYHRCGRTDKGVSAFGQVISISLRSKLSMENQQDMASELPYCKMLNRLLPKEIRAIAWMPISDQNPEFSARIKCYVHCFFTATAMYYLNIEGNAFLWHQIRCIMGVLLLVGEGKESPDVVAQLLDIENYPRKPQYNMALDLPLNLFHSTYDLRESEWFYDSEELQCVISQLQGDWTMHSIKATMVKDCLQHLEFEYNKIAKSKTDDTKTDEIKRESCSAYANCLLQGVKPKVYTPLLKRDTCSSLEERVEYYRKKRKRED